MIIIYDFDGTLTPYSFPQYSILKQLGVKEQTLKARIAKKISMGKAINLYEAYYKCYKDVFQEKNVPMTRDNVCQGAESVQLNNGVLSYFKRFQHSKTGIRHYIVTSGIQDFVEDTPISSYVDGIYGVTFKKKNGIFQHVDRLLSDKKKVDVIKSIQAQNNGTCDIIYFGDGLTDKCAFEYIHSIGGKNVFVTSNSRSITNYKKLNKGRLIDECFDSNFGIGSKISRYVR